MGLKTWGRSVWGALQGKSQTDISAVSVEGKDEVFPGTGYCAETGRYPILTDTGPFGIGSIYLKAEDPWETYDDEMLQAIYTLNAVVYACCRIIATSFAEPPIELGRMTAQDEWKKRENETPINLLLHPNDWYTYNIATLLQITRKHLTGAAYTWKWRNRGGQIAELWPIPTHWVTRVDGCHGIEGYYIHYQQPNEKWIDAKDMVYDRFPAMDSVFGYVGPMTACLHDYQIDKKREEYLVKIIGNLIRPGMVITQNAHDGIPRQGLTEDQRNDLRKSLKTEGTGGTPIFPVGLEPKFPGAIKDLDWSSTEGLVASRICMVFGVPPIVIGARVGIEHSTYTNYPAAIRSFYNETMIPLWRAEQELWTEELIRKESTGLPPSSNSWEFRYNLKDIVELQEDKNERMRRGVQALTAGAITVNEFRQEFAQMEKLEDGNVYLRAANIIAEPVGARPETPEEMEEQQNRLRQPQLERVAAEEV